MALDYALKIIDAIPDLINSIEIQLETNTTLNESNKQFWGLKAREWAQSAKLATEKRSIEIEEDMSLPIARPEEFKLLITLNDYLESLENDNKSLFIYAAKTNMHELFVLLLEDPKINPTDDDYEVLRLVYLHDNLFSFMHLLKLPQIKEACFSKLELMRFISTNAKQRISSYLVKMAMLGRNVWSL